MVRRLAYIITALMMLIGEYSFAQTQMEVRLDKEMYMPGDTIRFHCRIPDWEGTQKIATLNLWIENTDHSLQWKLRYPILVGLSEGELVIPDTFPTGRYAFYFQMQDEFWGVFGSFDQFYKNKTVDYSLLLNNNEIVSGTAPVSKDGKFKLARHVFPGQAKLFFAEVKKQKYVNSDINITISTPLDSAFGPLADTLLIRSIGETGTPVTAGTYTMDRDIFGGKKGGTLDNVNVIAKKKTRVEEFDDAVSSGMFRSPDAYVFSGLDDQFGTFFSIMDYLVGRIPGFQALRRPPSMDYQVSWRGETPSFFLDEIPVFAETIAMVPVNDIALVKVFRTPIVRSFVGGAGGVIAIYTKRGGGLGGKTYKNTFPVNGFTPLVYPLIN